MFIYVKTVFSSYEEIDETLSKEWVKAWAKTTNSLQVGDYRIGLLNGKLVNFKSGGDTNLLGNECHVKTGRGYNYEMILYIVNEWLRKAVAEVAKERNV